MTAVTLHFILNHTRKTQQYQQTATKNVREVTTVSFSVKDEKGRAIPGASIEAKTAFLSVRTDDRGLASLLTRDDHPSPYTVQAPGYKPYDLVIYPSQLNPNVAVSLRSESSERETQATISKAEMHEPYTQVFRSGPQDSGIGREFGPWFQLRAAAPRPGYEIDATNISYSLSGDRSCNSWSECKIDVDKTHATLSFRMQGHVESVVSSTFLSEGILAVHYIPAQANNPIVPLSSEITADSVLLSLRRYISSQAFPHSRTNKFWYIWLDMSELASNQVQSVTYTFDSEYMRYPVEATINPTRGTARFGASNCDTKGMIRVRLKNGQQISANFNLCDVQLVTDYAAVPQ